MATITLDFDLHDDLEGNPSWEYPDVEILSWRDEDGVASSAALAANTSTSARIVVTAAASDVRLMLGHAPYESSEGADWADTLDVWLHAGEPVEATVEDLTGAISELVEDLPGLRRACDEVLEQEAALRAECAAWESAAIAGWEAPEAAVWRAEWNIDEVARPHELVG